MEERLQYALLQMIPFLMAIVGHEFAHALVARYHGDKTAEDLGRLTLNPVPHIDPIGTLVFPLINMLSPFPLLFGWARPVPINYNRLKPFRSGLFFVALAGPAANVAMAVVAALSLVLLTAFVPSDFYFYEPLRGMAFVAVSINYALAVFNLIPLPPLDGSKMVQSFLSFNASQKYERLSTFSFLILLGLMWTGGLSILSIPITYLSNLSIAGWVTLFAKIGIITA